VLLISLYAVPVRIVLAQERVSVVLMLLIMFRMILALLVIPYVNIVLEAHVLMLALV